MGLRRATLVAGAFLLIAGLYAASPFLTSRLVGTGEAYNYSLSVADALVQLRAGNVPPLAGQSDFAFNGRIHPLRDAPYLHYLAYAIDLATGHRLPFWQVQNLSLTLSIVAAAFACYAGLRWATDCRRPLATALAALYVLAPPLLCSAHSLNLFMTVHAAVFVPLAMAACVQGCRRPAFKYDALLAAALAATWLAHPPVALWLTATTALLRLACFLARPGLRELVNGTAAVALGAALASFVFVSTATLSDDLGLSSPNPGLWRPFALQIINNLRSVFPASLMPVHRSGGRSGDLQLGYFAYALLALGLWRIVRGSRNPDRRLGIYLCGAAVALLGLLLPVPILMPFAWKHFPPLVYQITTEWPIQRLYLIALALTLFATPLLAPAVPRGPRWLTVLAFGGAFAWTLYQAQAFVARGFLNRRPAGETETDYQPSNFSLTSTSYAYLNAPPTYVDGVNDPLMDYRVLYGGKDEMSSQLSAALGAPIIGTGEIRYHGKEEVAASRLLRLLPGHRYLVTFDFPIPPMQGVLYVVGTFIHRVYALPSAGAPAAFGMAPGNSRALTLWTDSKKPEDVQIEMVIAERARLPPGHGPLATFSLHDIDLSRLPVQVRSSFPLRFQVQAPGLGYTVETPRRFIPGYLATVNGNPARVLRSPTGSVMIALPPGTCDVQLTYPGPGAARLAFWFCAACWALFGILSAAGLLEHMDPWKALAWLVLAAGRPLAAHWLAAALAVALAAGLGGYEWRQARRQRWLAAAGPIAVTFELPYDQMGLNEPLVVTGHVGEGVMVFVRMIDPTHILLGADVWGQLYQTPPFEIDYSQRHQLVVSDLALLPPANPRVGAMSKSEREYFGKTLQLELDGQRHLAQDCFTFSASPEEIYIGRAPFGSNTQPEFTGPILRTVRLPIPRRSVLPNMLVADLVVGRSAASTGPAEPLLTILKGTNSRVLTLRCQSPHQARLSLVDAHGLELQGADLELSPTRPVRMEVSYEDAPDRGSLDRLHVAVAGKTVLTLPDQSAQEQVPILVSGLDQLSVPGLAARFTGPQLELNVVPKATLPAVLASPATADLVVLFPANRKGRQEPLLTTGRSGAGDAIYVIYVDGHHVRVGLDHWNAPGALSPPIELDYGVPHEIRITSDALVPPGGPASEKGTVVTVDGAPAINFPTAAYPTRPEAVAFGHNRIGASSADPDFAGTILYLSRGGIPSLRSLD